MVHRHQPQRDHLAQDGAPFLLAAVGADAEHGQRIVVPGLDAFRLHPAQHFDHMAGSEALVDPVDGRQQLLHRHRAVERHGRDQTGIAVAARRRALAEVVEQAHPPAAQCFAQAQHGVELHAQHALEGLVGFRLVDHAPLQHHVLQAVGHPGAGGHAVAAGAARLLVVALDALGQIEVAHEAHVRLVDTHAESDGGHHHDIFLAQEAGLVGGALGVLHAGVVGHGPHPVLVEEFGRLLHLLARQAVDDAAVAAMLAGDEVQQLLAAVGLLDDLVADVGPVERGHELHRVFQLQPVHDLVAGLLVGRGGEGDARHVGELLVQHRQLDVLGPEVVAPLRYAVGLVDGEQGDVRILEQVQAALRHQPFRRHVHQVDLAGAHQALDAVRFLVGLGRVEEGGAHAHLGQCVDLVLHQRDQRRDHHAHAVADQRRDLVAQRLAAAGGHQYQRVAARAHVFHNLGLLAAEGRIAENGLQQLQGVGAGVSHDAGLGLA